MYLEKVIYSKKGGTYRGVLQRPLPPKAPAAKFWCDAHVRTDAQITFLYYPLPIVFMNFNLPSLVSFQIAFSSLTVDSEHESFCFPVILH